MVAQRELQVTKKGKEGNLKILRLLLAGTLTLWAWEEPTYCFYSDSAAMTASIEEKRLVTSIIVSHTKNARSTQATNWQFLYCSKELYTMYFFK